MVIFLGSEKDGTNKQESSKSRPDLSAIIFEELTLPLRDGQSVAIDPNLTAQASSLEGINTNDPTNEINVSALYMKTWF